MLAGVSKDLPTYSINTISSYLTHRTFYVYTNRGRSSARAMLEGDSQKFLIHKTFYVYINKGRSSTRTMLAGVPQESVIDPILFNIYIHDLSMHTKTTLLT